jgi:nicotinamidase-related amidase
LPAKSRRATKNSSSARPREAHSFRPLAIYLIRDGVDSLIVMGTTTSRCARASGLLLSRLPCFAESAGCFDRSQFFHDVSLCDINTKCATVVAVAERLDYLRGFALKAAE